jgi:hypothetical protein
MARRHLKQEHKRKRNHKNLVKKGATTRLPIVPSHASGLNLQGLDITRLFRMGKGWQQ